MRGVSDVRRPALLRPLKVQALPDASRVCFTPIDALAALRLRQTFVTVMLGAIAGIRDQLILFDMSVGFSNSHFFVSHEPPTRCPASRWMPPGVPTS